MSKCHSNPCVLIIGVGVAIGIGIDFLPLFTLFPASQLTNRESLSDSDSDSDSDPELISSRIPNTKQFHAPFPIRLFVHIIGVGVAIAIGIDLMRVLPLFLSSQ